MSPTKRVLVALLTLTVGGGMATSCGGTLTTSGTDSGAPACDEQTCEAGPACVDGTCYVADVGAGDAATRDVMLDVSEDMTVVEAGDAEGGAAVDAATDSTDAAQETGCVEGTLGCNGQQPEICGEAGTWEDPGPACSGSVSVCLGGTCVQCVPGSTQCTGNAIETCGSNDTWGSAVACADAAPACCTVACVDLQTDPLNCGTCGHSCQGGACSGGACQPVVLASGQMNPQAIAVNATSVCWTNLGTEPNYTDGTLMQVPLGGGTPSTVASGQTWTRGLAVNATSAAWTDQNTFNGLVMRASLGSGGGSVLASGQSNPNGIAVDGTTVYWTNYSTPGSVVEAPLGGGMPVTIASVSQGCPSYVAVDSSAVYWTDSCAGTVMKTSRVGNVSTTLASGQTNAGAIAVDATSAYWVTSSGTVVKVPIGGGTLTTLSTGQTPQSIAVDATSVYWVSTVLTGAVMAVPLGGGSTTTFASGQPYPVAVAVDATSVYWTLCGTYCGQNTALGFGLVMKLAK